MSVIAYVGDNEVGFIIKRLILVGMSLLIDSRTQVSNNNNKKLVGRFSENSIKFKIASCPKF